MKAFPQWLVVIALLLGALPDMTQAQLTFTTNNGTITITGYNSSAGPMVIPGSTNGCRVNRYRGRCVVRLVVRDGNLFHGKYSLPGFGFNITGNNGLVVKLVACTNLTNPTWIPAGTNTLANGSAYFSDSAWMNYSRRFYHLSLP